MALGNQTFKRGQVEWALWRLFALAKSPPGNPPKVFLTRVKRLLESDRNVERETAKEKQPPAKFAFSSSRSEGQGVDAAFGSFDAFCLALALDLADMGFKPSEIVLLLRHLRPQLEQQFAAVLLDPPLLEDEPMSPETFHKVMSDYALGRSKDPRVFWLIEKVELKEIYRKAPGRPGQTAKRGYLAPAFCQGIGGLFRELNDPRRQVSGLRRALVLEIAYLAARVATLLAKAPVTKRGRK